MIARPFICSLHALQHAEIMSAARPILVTGGSGFLGSWVVKCLLDRGHHVRTTVRSLAKAQFLLSIPGHESTDKLQIYEGVDLNKAESWDCAFEGGVVDAVIHTASPFFFENGTEENLVLPAVNGTRNVLSACNKHNVKTVVLTSSTAAIYVHHGTRAADHVYTEQDWSPEDVLRSKHNWYALSKTLAEQLAWDVSRQADCTFTLSVMNPTLIMGGQLPGQPHLNTSLATLVGYFDGVSMKEMENSCKSLVDVRDCALAHVLAATEKKAEAAGKRFLLIAASPHSTEIAAAVKKALPVELQKNVPTTVCSTLPTSNVMANPAPNPVLWSSHTEAVLGLQFRGVEEMVGSGVQSCLENGFNSRTMYSTDKL